MKHTEKTITYRIPDPKDYDTLSELSNLCDSLQGYADDMRTGAEYADIDNPEETEFTQAKYEMACFIFTITDLAIKKLWEE